jgi:hypothetical protein
MTVLGLISAMGFCNGSWVKNGSITKGEMENGENEDFWGFSLCSNLEIRAPGFFKTQDGKENNSGIFVRRLSKEMEKDCFVRFPRAVIGRRAEARK